MSESLHFAEHTLQEMALVFMGIVYILRVRWFLSFKAGKERQAATGSSNTTPKKGILYSWVNIAMPWAMESTRSKPFMYIQFIIFHLGVVAAIGHSFIVPYAKGLAASANYVLILQIFTGAAFLVGVLRLIRRFGDKYMRAISTPDDYFSLILLTVWFFCAFLAAPHNLVDGETVELTFFWMTAFFLIYVPFSKISHYLYYPFTRFYFGKSMGHRGVYPMQRGK
ncbi:hypothetical protein KKA00_00850 [bacterium]|nr:hypothetical protein [bacterium]MBU1650739.1 hypothetical protein [bacterium]